MKSDKEPGNDRDSSNKLKNNIESSAYDNSIETGSVGIEGGGDNGASTLRLLRKKRGITGSNKADPKRPVL
jgi:hypothetical protein